MGYEVVWTESAVEDAEHYAEYIAHHSPLYASYFTQQIRELAKSLKQMPERGRVVPFMKRDDIRELLSGHYRLIYQIRVETVYIIAVEHGARLLDIEDLDQKLK